MQLPQTESAVQTCALLTRRCAAGCIFIGTQDAAIVNQGTLTSFEDCTIADNSGVAGQLHVAKSDRGFTGSVSPQSATESGPAFLVGGDAAFGRVRQVLGERAPAVAESVSIVIRPRGHALRTLAMTSARACGWHATVRLMRAAAMRACEAWS
jgi:hypothetical protein